MTYDTHPDVGDSKRSVGIAGVRSSRFRAFTVIEMLVVLVIIGILAGIVITLAQKVSQGGKFSATRNVLEIADSLLTEYVTTKEAPPPQFVRTNQTQQNTNGSDDMLSADTYVFPIIDGRYDGRTFGGPTGGGGARFDKDLDPAQPSGALVLMAMAAESSTVQRELKGIDARFLKLRDVYAYGWKIDPMTGDPMGQPVLRRLRVQVLVDAFGAPIRYVHPGFQGGYGDFWDNAVPATVKHRVYLDVGLSVSGNNPPPPPGRFSRSYRPFGSNTPNNPVGDADEGLAIGGHGYFYSAGVDGDPGTRQDNVYSKEPSFPSETAKLN